MNCIRIGALTVLAAAILLATDAARALPRESVTPPPSNLPVATETKAARRARLSVEMDAWLRRLVGRFNIDGVSYVDGQETNVKPAKGKEDCIGLGSGAGVQCVINVVWDEDWGSDGQFAEAGVSSLAPAMIEYGMDPVASRIRYLEVDNQSLAEGAAGVLSGDTVTSRVRCVNTAAMPLCERVTRIYAPADSNYVQMTIDVEKNHDRASTLMLYLRRVPLDQAGDAGADVKLPELPKDQDKQKDPKDPKDQDKPRQRVPQQRSAPPMRGGGSRRR